MSIKALKQGSSEPPFKPGTIRIYGHRFCPFTLRPLLVAYHKSISIEVCNINTKDKPDWYLLKTPTGKVPLLEIDGCKFIHESLIIAQYLDEIALPGSTNLSSLQASDPYERAVDRMFLECLKLFDVLKIYYESDNRQVLFNSFVDGSRHVDEELARRYEASDSGGPFFKGKTAGFVDFMVWPFYYHYLGIRGVFPELELFSPSNSMTSIERWIDAMKALPAVKKLVPITTLTGYAKLFVDGKYDFDFGLE